MPRRSTWVPLLLLCACRAEQPRDAMRVPHAAARATPAWSGTADGCRQVAGQRPDTTIDIATPASDRWRRAVARGVEYRCEIDPSLTLRFVVSGDTLSPSLDSVVVYTDSASPRLVQVLHRVGDAEMPLPYHTDILSAMDLDADGHRDVLVGRFWGATGNRNYEIWRFEPETRRFVADSALSDMWNPLPVSGRPCVATSSNSSVLDDSMGVFCFHGAHWSLDSAERNTWQRASHTVRHEIMARRGDSLVIVKVETRPDSM